MKRILLWWAMVLVITWAAIGAITLGTLISHATFLAHPLGLCTGTATQVKECRGYNFWSGIVSDLGEITIVGGLITIVLAMWHHHNCHVPGCWRWSWHPNPETGHPECKVHHPDPHAYLAGTRHRQGRRLRIHIAHRRKVAP